METAKLTRMVDPAIKLFDIAANLSDETYFGKYRGKERHPADIKTVLERANQYNVEKFLFSAGHIEDAVKSYELAVQFDQYCTIGVHPCRANETKKDGMTPEGYMTKIDETIESWEDRTRLVAIGECGLDYDRLEYSDKETQLAAFPPHFEMA
jgi:TatD DNase family protein